MLKLAAFADEISPNLDDQIRVCKNNGVTHFELRSVAGRNVLDFDKTLRNDVKRKLADNNMGVISIGSPIGKVKIDEPWQTHFDRFKLAVETAEFFQAPLLRLFSYYAPEGGDIHQHRDEIIRRFQHKVDYLAHHPGVTMIHENERHIYGERGAACLDLMKTINSPRLRMAFDFANFVQAGQRPLECWPELKPYTAHIHIKDAKWGSGKVVPAGKGDGEIEPILKDAWTSGGADGRGYRGLLSMEPHLAAHEQFGGFSGEQLFNVAVEALREMCERLKIPLAR
ncbi:MAG TPA: TIM barrel protein [Tepidisphaeraceae bacterium]|jgi:sugar phosphate isomerase/epimerase